MTTEGQNEQEFYGDGEAPRIAVQVNNNGSGDEYSGAQTRRDIPGNEGFYVSGGGQGNVYNAAAEILSMPPDDIGVFLARASIDLAYLTDLEEMHARLMRMYTGYENPVMSIYIYLTGTRALGGRAMDQFVEVVRGERQIDISNRTGGAIAQRLLGPQTNNLSNR